MSLFLVSFSADNWLIAIGCLTITGLAISSAKLNDKGPQSDWGDFVFSGLGWRNTWTNTDHKCELSTISIQAKLMDQPVKYGW